jgi:predicted phage baseplate assembly protein
MRPPSLDHRRFEDMVREARSLIPRYAPEWTEYSADDPGVVLVQLFAWAAGALLVWPPCLPRHPCTRFLTVLGVEPRPARSAHVDVTFQVAEAQVGCVITVPAQTRVAAADASGEDPLVFEVEQALAVRPARLERVLAYSGHEYTDVTQQSQHVGQTFAPFGVPAREGNALLMGFARPGRVSGGFARTGLDLTFVIPARPDSPAGSGSDPRSQVPAELLWEHWDREAWRPLRVDGDTTQGLRRSGHVVLRPTGRWLAAAAGMRGGLSAGLYWMRVRVGHGTYRPAPLADTVCINSVGAVQLATQRDEVIGSTDGTPGQVLRLAHAPVRAGTLALEVDEGDGFRAWEEVPSLAASGPHDRHFEVRCESGGAAELHFGDGQTGRIPAVGREGNVIARTYRYGGGRRGNVAAGAVNTVLDSIPGIEGVTNLRPAAGGADAETLEEARCRAPAALRDECGAVVRDWLEALARGVCHVRHARAILLARPGCPGRSVAGAATVVVAPDSDATSPPLEERVLRAVWRRLQHHPLCSELHVVPAQVKGAE